MLTYTEHLLFQTQEQVFFFYNFLNNEELFSLEHFALFPRNLDFQYLRKKLW